MAASQNQKVMLMPIFFGLFAIGFVGFLIYTIFISSGGADACQSSWDNFDGEDYDYDYEEYEEDKLPKHLLDHGLFIAYAPAEDPQIAIAVIVENGEAGSSAAAPVARKMFDAYLLNAAGEVQR